MEISPKLQNPFEEHGYSPALMDVTIQALKRGHNGERRSVVIPVEHDFDIVVLTPTDRDIIADIVDSAIGVESARTVGYCILSIVNESNGKVI